MLSRVLKGYADLLHPLDQTTAGRQSKDKVTWTDDLHQAFVTAQQALKNSKTITLPRSEDTLWIVTDGSVKCSGIAATSYILRDEKLQLAGFFNAKLKKHQVTWLPCEVEAFCIAASVQHFAPYIIQSQNRAQILTDNRPCVQSYDKLCRGEFSASSRLRLSCPQSAATRPELGTSQGLPTCHLTLQAGIPYSALTTAAKSVSSSLKQKNLLSVPLQFKTSLPGPLRCLSRTGQHGSLPSLNAPISDEPMPTSHRAPGRPRRTLGSKTLKGT